MISIKVDSGLEQLLDRFDELTGPARKRINMSLARRLRRIVVSTFRQAGKENRPVEWPAKKDGKPSNLTKTTTLRRSFLVEATDKEGTVSTPVKYAAQHQFGGDFDVPEHDRTIRQAFGRPIDPPKTIRVRAYKMSVPARPFFPFDDQGNLTPSAERILVETAEAGIERELQRGSSG